MSLSHARAGPSVRLHLLGDPVWPAPAARVACMVQKQQDTYILANIYSDEHRAKGGAAHPMSRPSPENSTYAHSLYTNIPDKEYSYLTDSINPFANVLRDLTLNRLEVRQFKTQTHDTTKQIYW
jgi:hypothetical protein